MKNIVMDGIEYRVRIPYESLSRSFALINGQNQGRNIKGRELRDLIGTGYSYSLDVVPDPAFPADYDAFYQAISAPVDTHEITLPYGQTTMTFSAKVTSGSDIYRGKLGGFERWTGLSVNFEFIEPQRVN